MTEARTFWTVARGRGEIRVGALPSPEAGEAEVRTIASGISRGTETLVFQGLVPESEWQRMRAPFQRGDFPFPVAYGYAAVGIVEAGDPAWLGKRAFCLHPHQDRFVVPVDALTAVPDAVPDRRAVLAANLETAVNVLWDAPVRVGDRVAVVGGGVVGMLCALLAAAHPGAVVDLIDIDPGKAALAAALGLGFHLPAELEPGADLVVHASASEAGLAEALRVAGMEAVVVEASWFAATPVQVPLGEAFHSRRLTLRSSQVGRLPAERQARWSHRRRLALALRLLEDPIYDHLLEPAAPFAELPDIMTRLAGTGSGVMCQVIDYDHEHG